MEPALELPVALGRRVGFLELDQRRHQRLGDEAAAVAAEVALRVGQPAHRNTARLASRRSAAPCRDPSGRAWLPRPSSTSTAYGPTVSTARGDVVGREPAREDQPAAAGAQAPGQVPLDRLTGLALAPALGAVQQDRRRALDVGRHQGEVVRPPLGKPRHGLGRRELDRLDDGQRVVREILGLLVAVELQRPQPARLHRLP